MMRILLVFVACAIATAAYYAVGGIIVFSEDKIKQLGALDAISVAYNIAHIFVFPTAIFVVSYIKEYSVAWIWGIIFYSGYLVPYICVDNWRYAFIRRATSPNYEHSAQVWEIVCWLMPIPFLYLCGIVSRRLIEAKHAGGTPENSNLKGGASAGGTPKDE